MDNIEVKRKVMHGSIYVLNRQYYARALHEMEGCTVSVRLDGSQYHIDVYMNGRFFCRALLVEPYQSPYSPSVKGAAERRHRRLQAMANQMNTVVDAELGA